MKLNKKGEYKFFTRPNPRFDDAFVLNEIWETDTYRVRPEMFTGGYIIDVGANIGDFTVYASQFGRVRAYEPQKNNFEMLSMNVDINKDKLKHPVEIFKVGIGKKGSFTIDNSSGHSRVGRKGEPCECITIDEATKDIEVIDLLKIDIEGSEYDLFENISDETLKKVRYIVMEMHSWEWRDIDNPGSKKDLEAIKRHKWLVDKINKWFDCSRWSIYNSTIGGKNRETL
ncbi:MAG: FkbM family methyltransferase [Candidatus Heimdallarchaeaceae archaeon]